jgi:hypothetical protein
MDWSPKLMILGWGEKGFTGGIENVRLRGVIGGVSTAPEIIRGWSSTPSLSFSTNRGEVGSVPFGSDGGAREDDILEKE